MTDDDTRLFPYPRDPAKKLGFIIGDILTAGILGLLLVAVFWR